MGNFAVQLAQSAGEDLNEIHERLRKQVIKRIKSLSDNPLPTAGGIKKLKGIRPPLYRLRSGDYRVLYRLEATTVTILRIIDRKELEKIIRRWKL
jgi:mRNA interferase RelE/StbE